MKEQLGPEVVGNLFWTGLASVGKNRWLWCIYEHDEYFNNGDPAYGYVPSKQEGLAAILKFTKARAFYHRGSFYDPEYREQKPDELSVPYARDASRWRHILAERRRKPNPKAPPRAQATEYVYHQEDDGRTCAHRILKKTAKCIVVECCDRDHMRPGELGGTMRLDRERLETVNPRWPQDGPGYYVTSGYRFRGAMCGAFFTLDPEHPSKKKLDGADIPECLKALGLGRHSTTRE